MTHAKQAFFDGIAAKWDSWFDLDELNQRLLTGLRDFEIQPGESVMDLGCGTGNLTRALLALLSDKGRVVAVDLSPEMLHIAKTKITDSRAAFLLAQVCDLPLENAVVDRVLCYSAWPHFPDPVKALSELHHILKPNGMLHIWHLDGREKINQIHHDAGEAVSHDILLPAEELGELMEKHGFKIVRSEDEPDHYLLSAIRLS